MPEKWIFCRTPPITAIASPKSTWACPGGWASGTKVSHPRARPIRTSILHHRVAAGKTVLIAKTLEDPLGRVELLHRRALVRPPGSRRSPGAKDPASASRQASFACTPAAERTGTSSRSSRGSDQKTRAASRRLLLIEHKITYRRVHLISEHPRQTQKGSAYPRATTNGGASLDGSVTALHRFVRQYILGSTLSSATGSAKSIREQDRPGAVPRPFNRAA
jgi:hypothetical protein